jgi:hypothetical protein
MPPPPVPQTQVKEEEADPATAAWFASSNVKPKSTRSAEDSATESDTATEPDSDNDDVKEEDNDWDVVGYIPIESEFQMVDGQVRRSTVCEEVLSAYGLVQEAAPHQLEVQKAETQDEGPIPQPVMGETDDDMEYDTELIFKHLYVWRSKTVYGLTM